MFLDGGKHNYNVSSKDIIVHTTQADITVHATLRLSVI
jgi:hypothetical protein